MKKQKILPQKFSIICYYVVVTRACMYCQKLWSYGEELAATEQRKEGSSYGGSVCEEERISDSCMTNESWLIRFANGFKLTQKPC